MPTTFPMDAPLIDEPEIGFVDKGRGLQRVACALPAHIVPGEPAELVVDEWHQLVERRFVSITPVNQQLSYVSWVRLVHILGPATVCPESRRRIISPSISVILT